MKTRTREEITEELHAHGRDAESHALTLIRCLDYKDELVLDDKAYRLAVRTILDAMEYAREQRLADMRAHLAETRAEERRRVIS